MRCFVIMGVAGSGKTSVGAAVAEAADAVFVDGDDLHPAGNIRKMSDGTPLTDADREPWLDRVGHAFTTVDGRCLIGCSALRRPYRDRIRAAAREPVGFLHLSGSRAVIKARMAARTGHFMPVELLDSQFATLEPLELDEDGMQADIDQSLEEVVAGLVSYIRGWNT